MHDTLGYFQREPVHRAWHHNEMTFALVYAWAENFVLPISHDEVVHGKGSLLRKMPGDRWQQLANLRAFLAYMWAHPGKQLLFMGVEFGQESEWAEARELDWWLLDHPEHRGVHDAGARPQPRLRRHPRAVVARRRARLASAGSTPTTPAATCSPSSGSGGAATRPGLRGELRRRPARRLPPRPALGRASGTRSSTPTPRPTPAPASATSAAIDGGRRASTTASPPTPTVVLPPLATVWFRKRDD